MASVVREKARAAAVEKRTLQGLIAYNRPFAGPARYKRLVLSAREGRRFAALKGTPAKGTSRFFYARRLRP